MADAELKLSDRLAVDRTMLAAERTVMAWVRTAVSLISFGFTLYKVLEQFASEAAKRDHPHGAKRVGLFLICLGTVTLAGGLWEYWRTGRRLGRSPRELLLSPTVLLAGAVGFLGLFLFTTIALHFEVL